jgi:ADP-ribosyl-[dinitrogen reductase] hydrolase
MGNRIAGRARSSSASSNSISVSAPDGSIASSTPSSHSHSADAKAQKIPVEKAVPVEMERASTLPVEVLRDRCRGSLLGFFIGDALAMPIHWYYDIRQLREDFGKITKYEAPKSRFPGSIMNLSNTGGGGRGSDQGTIVGSVILHGKRQYWKKGGQYHYHHGMQAGDNTLDALVTLVMVKTLIKNNRLDASDFVKDYIAFMTTPGTHNDTYAGTCHRMFFTNMVAGTPLEQCPDNDSHNVDAIDALMIIPPIVWSMLNSSKEERDEAITTAIMCTRRCTVTIRYALIYADMLHSIATGKSTVAEAAITTGKSLGLDIFATLRINPSADPMTACYITAAFPALLHFAVKYADKGMRAMLLASANAGGENVARSALLGALMGAAVGADAIDAEIEQEDLRLKAGLVRKEELNETIDLFIDQFIT